jgi:hypothetical protein
VEEGWQRRRKRGSGGGDSGELEVGLEVGEVWVGSWWGREASLELNAHLRLWMELEMVLLKPFNETRDVRLRFELSILWLKDVSRRCAAPGWSSVKSSYSD